MIENDNIIFSSLIIILILTLIKILLPLLCIAPMLFFGTSKINITGGKSTKNIEKTMKVMLKEYNDNKIMINVIDIISEKYGINDKNYKNEIKRQEEYYDKAKKIYEKEKSNDSISIFNDKPNIKKYIQVSKNDTNMKYDIITDKIIKKNMKYRILNDDYDECNVGGFKAYNIKDIEYYPHDKQAFKNTLEKLFELSIIEASRTITDDENKEINEIIKKINTGQLFQKKIKVNFLDGSFKHVYSCDARHSKLTFSNIYKKLHWGQRKLILSEIDFFNRTSKEMGIDNFKKQNISVIYPGSAHGHKLMIQMMMFPNVIYYLWDPAMFNTILYISDFIRRGIKIHFDHTTEEMNIAKQFVGRIFINMDLDNETYLKYHKNSTSNNISENYKPEWGFFTEKTAKCFLENKKDNNPTLFISDIRLFSSHKAIDTILYNNFKDYSDLVVLNNIYENINCNDFNRDMILQKEWFKMVNATYGLFKFKLKNKKYLDYYLQKEYLDGDIILQAWAPIDSGETRLFVSPNHKDKAYYNINKYLNKIKTFNKILRVHNMSNIKLKELGITLDNKDITVGEIWNRFLPEDLIGQDAILEIYILYDYLCMYKDKKNIKSTDIMLLISDITQTLINRSDYSDVLGYFNNVNPYEILDKRSNYHSKFIHRLDYTTHKCDNYICEIFRKN